MDLSQIPAHMRDGVKRYVEEGIPPGGFELIHTGKCVLAADV